MATVEETVLQQNVELLLGTATRAFYDDTAVCVVDGLLRDKFWKEDGKGTIYASLSKKLGRKLLRQTLVFLQKEHLVATEEVSGVVETSDEKRSYRREKSAKFWYIDYNRAVHSIRLRLFLMSKQLHEKVISLSSNSIYACPTCKQQCTELDVVSCPMTPDCSAFLCFDCHEMHKFNPDPPDICTYTLKVVDRSEELQRAEASLCRMDTQLREATSCNNQKLRNGVFDLLHQIQLSRLVVPSNLPSENCAEEFLGKVQLQEDEPPSSSDPNDAIIRTRTVHGDQVELQVESMQSQRAHALSTMQTTHGEKQELEAAVTAKHRMAAAENREMFPPPNVPLPKIACRQTTPFFLKDKSGTTRSEINFRRLSIGEQMVASTPDSDEVLSDGDEPRGTSAFFGSDDSAFCLKFFNQEKERQDMILSVKSNPFAGDLFLSASSTASSVQWQDGV